MAHRFGSAARGRDASARAAPAARAAPRLLDLPELALEQILAALIRPPTALVLSSDIYASTAGLAYSCTAMMEAVVDEWQKTGVAYFSTSRYAHGKGGKPAVRPPPAGGWARLVRMKDATIAAKVMHDGARARGHAARPSCCAPCLLRSAHPACCAPCLLLRASVCRAAWRAHGPALPLLPTTYDLP